jgi:molybdate transport system regulatory protein
MSENKGKDQLIMEIKFKVWLEKDGHVIFGEGRDLLLKTIDECHGLYGAAKKIKMSYRAAWGMIKVTEERLGRKIVDIGEDKKMHLTKEARRYLDAFDRLEEDINLFLQQRSPQFTISDQPEAQDVDKK